MEGVGVFESRPDKYLQGMTKLLESQKGPGDHWGIFPSIFLFL